MGLGNGSLHRGISMRENGSIIGSMDRELLGIVSAHIKANSRIF